MESQVEEIKKKLDIVEVIGKYLPLKKRGRHYLACCPFHGEKTPSFTVSPELQIFKCFGCGKAGDVFTFIQEFDHIDFKDALEDLAKMAGVTLVKSQQLTAAETHKKRLLDLNHQAAKFYNYILTSHPLGKNALEYVLKRGISKESIKLFRLGFSPQNSTLIVNFLKKKGFTDAELIATGTFGRSNYGGRLYDRFQDRLIFPLADFRDRVVGFSGRILPPEFRSPGRAAFDAAKYINSPETDLYHKSQMLYGLNLTKESIKKQNSVIVFEGEIDLISPFQIGVTHTVAIKGTAFTEDQLQLLKRYTDTLVLGLDSDFAGNNSARKSIALADSLGFDIQVLSLGDYKDPDEAVRSDPEFFKNQLAHTLPVWDFIINAAVKSHDPTTVRGKKEILELVLPFLVKIENSVTRSDYYHKLAAQINSDPEAISQEASKLINKLTPPGRSAVADNDLAVISSISTSITPASKLEKLEEYLLTLIISSKKPGAIALKIQDQFSFTTPKFQKIFLPLQKVGEEFDPKNFSDTLSPEIAPIFNSLYLSGTYLQLESAERLREIKKTLNQIQSMDLKDRLATLSAQIARAESQEDETLLTKLTDEYNQVLSALSRLQSTKG